MMIMWVNGSVSFSRCLLEFVSTVVRRTIVSPYLARQSGGTSARDSRSHGTEILNPLRSRMTACLLLSCILDLDCWNLGTTAARSGDHRSTPRCKAGARNDVVDRNCFTCRPCSDLSDRISFNHIRGQHDRFRTVF